MRRVRWGILAIALFASGCGAAGPPGFSAATQRASATETDLLYVAEPDADVAYAYTYPGGKLVNEISTGIEGAVGLCSDTAGNVYVTSAGTASIVEYAHGATSPTAIFYEDTKKGGHPNGCAVDPASGNLAVANGINHPLGIFTGPSDFGTYYTLSEMGGAAFCGFDDHGNLFIDGPRTTSGTGLILAELPRGAKALKEIKLNKRIHRPGAVQWDGKYLTVAAWDAARSLLYRLTISRSGATVAGTTPLRDEKVIGQSVIYRSQTIASYAVNGEYRKQVGAWAYPDGGNVKRIFQRPGTAFYGLAISAGGARAPVGK